LSNAFFNIHPRRRASRPVLSGRLQMVAELLPPGQRIVDIGTDHAYLPISTILNGRYGEAVATDVRSGPLHKAALNIKRFGLSDKISLKQTNGLAGIEQKPEDVVVIAGLGGLEMIDIIKNATATWPLLVLQPQKSAPQLRRFLLENSYQITAEKLCLDKGRLYLALLVQYNTSEIEREHTGYEAADYYLGPVLRRDRPPLFAEYLLKQRKQAAFDSKREPKLTNLVDEMNELIDKLKVADLSKA
jgi:tRNA (adenine22-N1)-methyltransferase